MAVAAASRAIPKAIRGIMDVDEYVTERFDEDGRQVELNEKDIKFNKELEDRIIRDVKNAMKATWNAGVRISGVPLLAPTQEFINPILRALKGTDIKIIREVTFDDMEDPQPWAERVAAYYKERKELTKKAKRQRPTQYEEFRLVDLDSFVKYADQKATLIAELSNLRDRADEFERVTSAMDILDDDNIDLKLDFGTK